MAGDDEKKLKRLGQQRDAYGKKMESLKRQLQAIRDLYIKTIHNIADLKIKLRKQQKFSD